jgi:beta-galactosidase
LFLTINIFNFNAANAAYKPFSPEQISEIVHSTQRTIISLQGTWERSLDGKNWEKVQIPFTDYEEKKVIYKKEIAINSSMKEKNIKLFFPGLAQKVEIYFNGDFITMLDGRFLPADINIPKKIINLDGKNEIRLVFLENSDNDKLQNVSVRNSPKIAKGIIREPFLIGTSHIYISELKYKLNKINALEVDMICVAGQITDQLIEKDVTTGNISSKKTRVIAEYQIINKRTNEAATLPEMKEFFIENSRTAEIKLNIPISTLDKWSIESPELYKLNIKLKQNDEIIDEYFVNFGKKTITANKNYFSLNGEQIEIKAISYNEFHGSVGNTLSAYRMEDDIKNIKLLGANAIKINFNAPHPYLVYLCEKYGLLLMLELPLINTNNALLENEEFITQNKNVLERIFQNYSNSTSFFAIGIGNCVIENKKFTELSKNFIALAKKYNKLVYKIVELGTNLDEINTKGYDFLCFRTNEGTNENIVTEVQKVKNKFQAIPLILNFSSYVKPGNLNGYSDPTSTEYQAFFIKNCYNLSVKEHFAGCLINSFNDYVTQFPLLTLDYYNKYVATDGITDIYRNNRQATATIKALFNDERLPLLNAGSYENSIPIFFIISGFLKLAILIFMLNRYSRFREYFTRAFLRPYNFFADIRDQRIMSIIQTLILGCLVAVSISLCFSSLFFDMRSDLNCSYLLTALFPFKIFLETLFKSAWHSELLLTFFFLLFIGIIYLLALFLRIIAKILRAKLFIDNTLTIVIWSALPFVILLPIGIILAKLVLLSPTFMYIFFVLFAFILIWSFLRLFKAIAIVLDKRFLQIYTFGFSFLILAVVIPTIYYQSKYSLIPFIEYFIHLP